jgi:V8-like Glu-specific endopeptidase
MNNPLISRHVRRSLALGLVSSVTMAISASAQQEEVAVGVEKTIAVSQTSSPWEDSPQYLADRSAGSNYSGVVNLWFRDANGAVLYGCTGSMLTGGKVLTAAHCVTGNGSTLLATSFTARFYQTGIGWVDVNGTGMAFKPGYVGNVVSEHDVAVLSLNSPPPSFARTYSLASGNIIGQTVTLAGYGRTGDGGTGAAFSNNQFNDQAVLRTGNNVFETTCQTSAANLINAGNCATNASGQAATKGGIFLADFDRNGQSTTGTVCSTLGFCTNSVGTNFAEVLTGPGDSGGANFLNDWTVAGVTSFGQVNANNIGSFFGFAGGYTCVANVAGNEGCQSNYNWVTSQISTVPEPSTVVLTSAGLLAMVAVARKRRKA